ncbi:MAG: biosynthesis protein [Paenibacillus sp.]|jgi:capsular polysaccharide biosynthesis protein|nr:biosynthesis protein [Paenibacillus sp.]
MELQIQDYIGILKKRLWLMVLVVVLGSTLAYMYGSYFVKPVYSATAKLMVNQSNVAQGGIVDQTSVNTSLMLVHTYKEIVKTSAIMEKAAESLSEKGLTPQQLTGKVKVNVVPETQILALTVTDTSFERAVGIASTVSEVFKSEIPAVVKTDNVKIIHLTKLSDRPEMVKPNRSLYISVAFVLSALISIGIVFVLEMIDNKIRSEKDVELQVGLPVLTTVAHMKNSRRVPKMTGSTKTNMVGDTAYAGANQ